MTKATPAAIAVLRQATALRPKRKKASDGLLPSAAHMKQSPTSDHNTGYAVDLTHDALADVLEDNLKDTKSKPENHQQVFEIAFVLDDCK